jgi:hypothetical protein
MIGNRKIPDYELPDSGGNALNGSSLHSGFEDGAPFNPLDTRNLGIAVAKALLGRKPIPIDSLSQFRGAGIYAIYYRGTFPIYAPISAANTDPKNPRWPIYVGKAIPPGGRKGKFSTDATNTNALFSRIRQHADSIRSTKCLALSDFSCRFLVVQDLWIPLAEQLLITHFSPIWNSHIDGFGNHDPGAGRYAGLKPRWDALHPGRSWATKCKERQESTEEIKREVEYHLINSPIPKINNIGHDIDSVS